MGTVATAYVTGDSPADFNLLLLLCAAGIAQQSQGYLLEMDYPYGSNDNGQWDSHIVVAYFSAIMLQSGEFAVVYDIIPEKGTNEILAYSNYVYGYSKILILF